MRREMREIEGYRGTFTGIFERYGSKSAYRGPPVRTLLLKDVRQDGRPVCDHLWLNETKGFAALWDLQNGDTVQFDGRVTRYVKGYRGRRDDVYKPVEVDYKLSRPTKVSIVARSGKGAAF